MEWVVPGIAFADRHAIGSKMIAQAEAHWEALRGNRDLPTRAELDPVNLKALLPYVSTVELHYHPFRVRYRVVGTEVTRFSGEDWGGRWLHETDWSDLTKQANLELYQRVAESRVPVFGISGLVANARPDRSFEWAIFPLTTDGTIVTHCFSIDDFTTFGRRNRLAGLDRDFDEP